MLYRIHCKTPGITYQNAPNLFKFGGTCIIPSISVLSSRPTFPRPYRFPTTYARRYFHQTVDKNRNLQFKTKIAHFATLFKTREVISWPWLISFCTKNQVIFYTNIMELRFSEKHCWFQTCWPLIASLHTFFRRQPVKGRSRLVRNPQPVQRHIPVQAK